MAKKKRKSKHAKKRAKSYRVSGVITRIRKKTKKARFIGPVHQPGKAVSKAVKKAVNDVKKVLKYPFKAGKGHVFGMKMKLRPKRKRTNHLPDFTD